MPTYVHGTVIPEISDLINRRSDSGRIGILFRFHGSFEYEFSGWVSMVGIPLHKSTDVSGITTVLGKRTKLLSLTCHGSSSGRQHRIQLQQSHSVTVQVSRTRARYLSPIPRCPRTYSQQDQANVSNDDHRHKCARDPRQRQMAGER